MAPIDSSSSFTIFSFKYCILLALCTLAKAPPVASTVWIVIIKFESWY